jgi:serine O-acetyltransferase
MAFDHLRADWRRAWEHSSGGRLRRCLACAAAPGVQAVTVYRFGAWLAEQSWALRLPLEPLYRAAYLLVQVLWGIELPRRAEIGPGLFIAHFGGIVVSERAVLGANCNLSQQITIGVGGKGAKSGVPQIGDDVFIAPGARLFGRIRIGNNVAIGANAVVYKDIPDDAVVILDPGFAIVSYKGNRRRAAPEAAPAPEARRPRAA